MNVGLTAETRKQVPITWGQQQLGGMKTRATSGMSVAPSQQKSQLQQGTKAREAQDTARPGHPPWLQGTLTANVRPQLVVIVLEQRVEDLCGIGLLCLGREDPGFIDAEVIVIVFLCALTPGKGRQRRGRGCGSSLALPASRGTAVSEMPKQEDAAGIKGRAQGAQGSPLSHH